VSPGPDGARAPRVAVVGHVEWVVHTRGALPPPGQIAFLDDAIEEPAGGGAITAAQVAKLGAECRFFTALGDDGRSEETLARLGGEGVEVLAARRRGPQTWALSAAGPDGERGIAVVGPVVTTRADDDLPWGRIGECEAAYFTAHDPGTLVHARRAGVLVVTSRRVRALIESGVRADVVVGSANDAGERFDPADLPVPPGAIVLTDGARGGTILADGGERRYAATAPPGPVLDAYGAGDSFAGGLTVGLAMGLDLPAACALGARCGAAALTARGGLAGQLRERG
jgi:ribokinase